MSTSNTSKLASLIIEDSSKYKEAFRLPPVLKNKYNLSEIIDFFIEYYSKDSTLTLKNAQKLTFSKVSASKMHLWMQAVSVAMRMHFLIKGQNTESINQAYYFFSKNAPQAPLVIKSALKKYKYLSIDNYTEDQFKYVCCKELNSLLSGSGSPLFIPEHVYNLSNQDEIASVLDEFIHLSESLEVEGKYALSEKLLNGAEKISDNLRHINGIN